MKLPPFFEEGRVIVDALSSVAAGCDRAPASIHTAMRYSVFAGGKRIRPILCLETARIFASDVTPPLHPLAPWNYIHTYSLIHDDLPALDNDDLRRGKPTCHKKFGEAIAILAGDALLTLAFETIGATSAAAEAPRGHSYGSGNRCRHHQWNGWRASRGHRGRGQGRRSTNAGVHPPLENRGTDPRLDHSWRLVRQGPAPRTSRGCGDSAKRLAGPSK